MQLRTGRALGFATILTTAAALLTAAAPGASVSGASVSGPSTERVLVTLRPGTEARFAAPRLLRGAGTVRHLYTHVLNGFAADLPASAVPGLRRDPRVLAVTPDRIAHGAGVQTAAPWGLDRIDQRGPEPDGRYGYDTTGAGVTLYVVDSGVRLSHQEFGGRAGSGYDFVDDDADASDCNGHGTTVAGIAGGATYGVAKGVKLVSVRVFGCENSGPFTGIIAAFDWVVANRTGPSVINFSGGGGAYAPMDQALTRTVAAGIPVVVAAMNNAGDACTVTPARAPAAITVGAGEHDDSRAGYSNFGSCLDLFAPGSGIPASAADSDRATAKVSGTSMAAPHVAGVIARFLQGHPKASAGDVEANLAGSVTKGVVTDARSARADLLYAAPASAQVDKPGPPTGVRAAQVRTTRSATLSWQPPATGGGSPITGYRVERSGGDTDGKSSWTATLPATARSVTTDRLKYGTAYTLSVRAVNAAGSGPPKSAKVTPVRLPGAVKIGKASSGKAGGTISATATWSAPPSDGGSAITGYLVTALRLDDRGRVVAGDTSKLQPATARKLELKLAEAGTYQFFVQAVNRAGAGPQSARSNKVSGR